MAAANHLRTISLVMAWGATLGALADPVVLTVGLLHPAPIGFFDIRMDIPALSAHVPAAYRYGAFATTLVPAGFTFWAWWSLRRLMLLYAKGDVFTQGALHQLHNIALALLCSVITGVLLGGVSSLVLSWPLGDGHRTMSLSFGSDNAAELFKAAAVYVIAIVMADARRIAEENAKFV